jgi:small subunit ribosomal protein S18
VTNEPAPPESTAPAAPAPAAAAAPAHPDDRHDERPRDRDDRPRDRDDRDDDRPRDRDRRGGGGGGGFRRRGCEFCINHTDILDYKDVERVRRYVGDRGKMEARRKVGTCAKHQRVVARAVKRARYMALLPYTAEHVRASGVPAGGRR